MAEQVHEPVSLSSLSPSLSRRLCVLWLCYLLVTRLFGSRSCWLGLTTSRSSADPCSGNVRSGAGQGAGGRSVTPGQPQARRADAEVSGRLMPHVQSIPTSAPLSGLLLPHCGLALLGLAVRRPCSSLYSVCGWGVDIDNQQKRKFYFRSSHV